MWDVRELGARYESFLTAFDGHRGAVLDDREAFLVRTNVVHRYRRFPSLDPGLPEVAGPRARAAALFGALYEALAEPAQRHFDERTAPSRASVMAHEPAALS